MKRLRAENKELFARKGVHFEPRELQSTEEKES